MSEETIVNGQKRLVLVSGRAHPQLAEDIASELDTALVHTDARTFANGEIYARYDESVRGCDAFVIQSHTAPDQRVAHGAAHHGGCPQAGIGEAHHRGRPLLPVRQAGQEGSRSRTDLRPARRRPVPCRRRRPHHERRPARRPDPGFLRRPGRPPVRHAGAARALPGAARPGHPHRRLARHGPCARRRHLERQARRSARHHPQAPRPARAEPGLGARDRR